MTPVMIAPPALLAATVLSAVKWGGKPERMGAAILFAWFVADTVLRQFSGQRAYVSFNPLMALLDMLAFFGFVALALRANRLWPIVAAALLTFPVLGHGAMLAGVSGVNWSYWIMTQVPPNAVAVLILVASLQRWRRSRCGKEARDWRTS